MRYFELMAERPLVWALFGVYMVVTSWLAWLGHKKTGDMRSFAVGSGDMNAAVVGITLAASIALTATFVINPGFVYKHGISALIHLGVAASLGIIVGLVAMSAGFQRVGAASGAVTLPQWIGERYRSKVLAMLFALISLLYLSFVVLIVGGLSIVMQQALGLSNIESLILVITFVFGYVFIGGAYAHAYTNTLQGLIMVVVALIIVGSGLHFFAGGVGHAMDTIAAQDPNLVKAVNPASGLFGSAFSVYVCGFVIGFALVCQPHIMTKALYVGDAKAVRRYLVVAITVSLIFTAMLLVGLYAHLSDIPAAALARQDGVVMAYVTHTFSPTMIAIITVALMAAGMSTLDGILVALSTIAGRDLYLGVAERRWLRDASEEQKSRAAHRASKLILVALGLVAFAISVHPPHLLGIFGQIGVYGIVAASAAPILFGILLPRFDATGALASSMIGLGTHFVLYAIGFSANPAVTATWGILASVGAATAVGAIGRISLRRNKPAAEVARTL